VARGLGQAIYMQAIYISREMLLLSAWRDRVRAYDCKLTLKMEEGRMF
jgi:hypothetical protein